MSMLLFIIVLVAIGIVMAYVQMDPEIRRVVIIVVIVVAVVVVVVWLIRILGIPDFRIP